MVRPLALNPGSYLPRFCQETHVLATLDDEGNCTACHKPDCCQPFHNDWWPSGNTICPPQRYAVTFGSDLPACISALNGQTVILCLANNIDFLGDAGWVGCFGDIRVRFYATSIVAILKVEYMAIVGADGDGNPFYNWVTAYLSKPAYDGITTSYLGPIDAPNGLNVDSTDDDPELGLDWHDGSCRWADEETIVTGPASGTATGTATVTSCPADAPCDDCHRQTTSSTCKNSVVDCCARYTVRLAGADDPGDNDRRYVATSTGDGWDSSAPDSLRIWCVKGDADYGDGAVWLMWVYVRGVFLRYVSRLDAPCPSVDPSDWEFFDAIGGTLADIGESTVISSITADFCQTTCKTFTVYESHWDCDDPESGWSTPTKIITYCGFEEERDWHYDRVDGDRIYYRRSVQGDTCACDGTGTLTDVAAPSAPTDPPDQACESLCDTFPGCDSIVVKADGVTVDTIDTTGGGTMWLGEEGKATLSMSVGPHGICTVELDYVPDAGTPGAGHVNYAGEWTGDIETIDWVAVNNSTGDPPPTITLECGTGESLCPATCLIEVTGENCYDGYSVTLHYDDDSGNYYSDDLTSSIVKTGGDWIFTIHSGTCSGTCGDITFSFGAFGPFTDCPPAFNNDYSTPSCGTVNVNASYS